jgi:uncharacterized membrane protein YcaP (DUF421 family)
MFIPNLPWWEFVVRAGVIYSALLVMVRISGKRTVGQFTPFDLLVVMLLSEGVSNSLAADDSSLVGALLVAGTLVALNAMIGIVASRSRRFQVLIEGDPVVIGREGQLLNPTMIRHRISEADVEEALRHADCDLAEMQMAVLESTGEISVLKKKP